MSHHHTHFEIRKIKQFQEFYGASGNQNLNIFAVFNWWRVWGKFSKCNNLVKTKYGNGNRLCIKSQMINQCVFNFGKDFSLKMFHSTCFFSETVMFISLGSFLNVRSVRFAILKRWKFQFLYHFYIFPHFNFNHRVCGEPQKC